MRVGVHASLRMPRATRCHRRRRGLRAAPRAAPILPRRRGGSPRRSSRGRSRRPLRHRIGAPSSTSPGPRRGGGHLVDAMAWRPWSNRSCRTMWGRWRSQRGSARDGAKTRPADARSSGSSTSTSFLGTHGATYSQFRRVRHRDRRRKRSMQRNSREQQFDNPAKADRPGPTSTNAGNRSGSEAGSRATAAPRAGSTRSRRGHRRRSIASPSIG